MAGDTCPDYHPTVIHHSPVKPLVIADLDLSCASSAHHALRKYRWKSPLCRRRSGVEPAVSTVLAEVLSQPTAWGDFEDWWVLPDFKARWKPALWLEPFPIAGGTPDSRRHRSSHIFGNSHNLDSNQNQPHHQTLRVAVDKKPATHQNKVNHQLNFAAMLCTKSILLFSYAPCPPSRYWLQGQHRPLPSFLRPSG